MGSGDLHAARRAQARGRQLGQLSQLAQEKATDPAIGRLLDELRPYEESLPHEHDDACLIRVGRREYERATKLPPEFVAEVSNHLTASYQAWTNARPANDFATVRPYLEKTLELSRRTAEFYPGYAHIADPLIDEADYGMTVASLRPLFAELRSHWFRWSMRSSTGRCQIAHFCIATTPNR